MKYAVSLEKTEKGYSVSVPGLPGCWSQGSTEQEALSNIADAILDYLAVARELAGKAELREIDVAVSPVRRSQESTTSTPYALSRRLRSTSLGKAAIQS